MGANDFTNFSAGSHLTDVFRTLQDHARWEHGHSGYTGTIAEKDGVELRHAKPMTFQEANAFIATDLEHNDKWGPAYAVRVVDVQNGNPVEGFLFYGLASS